MSKASYVLETVARRVETATTHYATLGVEVGVNTDTIRAAHRHLAGLLHPDRSKLSNAHELMARVNVAYSCLSDPEARRKYDFAYKIKAALCDTCKGNGFVLRQKGFSKKESATCPTCSGTGAKS